MKKIISTLFLAVCFIGLSSYSAEAKPIQTNIETSSESDDNLKIGMVSRSSEYVSKDRQNFVFSYYNMYNFKIKHYYKIVAKNKDGKTVVIDEGSLEIPAEESEYVTVPINREYSNYRSINLKTKRY